MMALTDSQMDQVKQAAALLQPSQRDLFLRSIANRLSEIAAPTDNDVATAVNLVLSCRGVSSMFCCDSATNNKLSKEKLEWQKKSISRTVSRSAIAKRSTLTAWSVQA